jgi:tRNA dimethylallyltransferase
MLPENLAKPLVLIVGPTGVGKSEFAIQLAERINGEIISADSRSFYRKMDIGTAKPSEEDMRRIRHHLINIAEPNETISLIQFTKLANEAILNIHQRGRVPFLVGGTGQYVRAILEGWEVPEGEPDPQLRDALEKIANEIGKEKLHEQLRVIDSLAAKNIDPANVRRTIRAFEVIYKTGRRFSDQRNKSGSPFPTLLIGLTRPRLELYARADQRIERMITNDLLGEVVRLISTGFSPELPSFSAIGYKEMSLVINNEISLQEAMERMKKRTRIFIRRQSAWFRTDDPAIHWLIPNENILGQVLKIYEDSSNWVIPAESKND